MLRLPTMYLPGVMLGIVFVTGLAIVGGARHAYAEPQPLFQQTVLSPAPPSYVYLTGVATNAISIAWTPSPSAGVQNYLVAWWQYGYSGDWTYVWLPANTLYFVQSGLPAFTRVAYEVQACSVAGCSAWSSRLDAATPAVLPAPPSNLYVSGILANAISLDWNPSPSADVQGYVVGVWQYGYSRTWSYLWVPDNQTFLLLPGLSPGTQYAFLVQAYNSSGYSAWSNQVTQWTHATYP